MKKRQPALYSCLLLSSLLKLYSCPAQEPWGASVSLSNLWSVRNNPAGLAWIKETPAGISYNAPFLLKKLSTKEIAVVIPMSKGAFGLHIENYGYSLIQKNTARFAFGKSFGKKTAAGISLDCQSLNLAEYGRKSRFIAEAGIQSKPLKGLTVGARLFNPSRSKLTSHPDERIPTTLRLGCDYRFSEKVFVCVETEKEIDAGAILKAGMEYHPAKVLYLRAGISSDPSIISFGMGWHLHDLRFDMNWSIHSVLGTTPQISLAYLFKSRK